MDAKGIDGEIEARRTLESFILSPELLELETRFSRFNVFEALGAARRELSHSSFLAFLLNPQESHGLGDLFVRRFLQDVARVASDPVVSVIELDDLDLSNIDCRREFQNIDILLRDSGSRVVAVIENKVGSTEHDDQLARYHTLVTEMYPNHRFIGVYLTPTGEAPKHNEYVAYSYEGVRRIIDDLLARESVLLAANFRSALEQYGDLLDRKLMADAKLQELCAKIYKRHKAAIDILLKNLPNEFARALECVKTLVIAEGYSILDFDNSTIRFIPDAFKIKAFRSEAAWLESSGQMVYLECKKKNDALFFQAKMDGGLPEERSAIHKFAQKNPPFKVEKSVYDKFQGLYSQQILDATTLSGLDDNALDRTLSASWSTFVKTIVTPMVQSADTFAVPTSSSN